MPWAGWSACWAWRAKRKNDMADNRSEKATARRKQKAREKGQVVRSRDLASALTLLALTLALSWQPQMWIVRWRGLFERLLATGQQRRDRPGHAHFLLDRCWPWRSGLPRCFRWPWRWPCSRTPRRAASCSRPSPLQPNWGRLNPASNLGTHLLHRRAEPPAALAGALLRPSSTSP